MKKIEVEEYMVGKIVDEYEHFNQLIEYGIQHYEKTNDPIVKENILNLIRRDRSEKNEFFRALAIIGFPGVSNVNGFYEFNEGEAYSIVRN